MPLRVLPLVLVLWCAALAGCGAATSSVSTSSVSTQPRSAANAATSAMPTHPNTAGAAPTGQIIETISEVASSATAERPAVRSMAMPAPLAGFLDMSGCPPNATMDRVSGVLGGCVAYVDWAQLEPSRGVFDFTAIDLQLDRVRAWNADRTANLIGLRVRVLTGARSPAWVIDIGGPHVTINLCGPNATLPACAEHRNEAVPRFWAPEFGTAYAELLVALDARYANEPALRDLAINRCTTIFDEPMVRTFGQAGNAQALLQAGYTESADLACQRASIDSVATLLPHTYLSQSFSTYEIPTVTNGVYSTGHSDERAIELMAYMRTTLAGRAVLGNNELGRGPGDNDAIYAYQRNVGAPLYYQLDSLDRLANVAGHPVDKWTVYSAASTTAVNQGASSIEIRGRDYRSDVTGFLTALGPYAAILLSNGH